MAHGFEQTSVDEIRQMLRDEYSISDPAILSSSKRTLIDYLLRLREGKGISDDFNEFASALDEAVEEPDEPIIESLPTEDTCPHINSPDWQQYVMRQFTEDELIDGNPTCDGCRRVVEELIGSIVGSEIKQYTPASVDTRGTATVVFAMDILVRNPDHPMAERIIHVEDIGDVGPHNTDAIYANFAAATAATRAEGRCLRKVLRLRNIVAAEETSKKAEEEVTGDDWSPDDPIDDNQIQVIDMMCRRLDMNVMQFINSGRKFYSSVNEVSHTTAQRMLQELNKIQTKTKPSPANVGPYDSNWRVNASTVQGSS